MAIKPKQILDTAVDAGKTAVSAAERRIRGRTSAGPSGAPSTVGASEPGAPGGHKSATASTRAQAATASTRAKKAKPKAKAKAKPRKPAKKRATASRAAATSGKQVKKAAKKA
jgi:hypothetical protein